MNSECINTVSPAEMAIYIVLIIVAILFIKKAANFKAQRNYLLKVLGSTNNLRCRECGGHTIAIEGYPDIKECIRCDHIND